MDNIEVAVKGNVSLLERSNATKRGAYFISCFVESLRGSKDFMMYAT